MLLLLLFVIFDDYAGSLTMYKHTYIYLHVYAYKYNGNISPLFNRDTVLASTVMAQWFIYNKN